MATGSSRLPMCPVDIVDICWEISVKNSTIFGSKRYLKGFVEALLSTMKEPLRWLLAKLWLEKLLLPKPFKPEQYDSIPPGTPLRVERVRKCIQHVGLAVGGGLVIHLRKADEHRDCQKCIYRKKANPRWSVNTNGHGRKGRVVVTCTSCFALGEKVVEIPFGSDHGVSAAFRTISHRGGKSYWRSSDPPEKVLDRAHDKLVNGLPRDYNLMHLNCDMFVYYCKTGLWSKKSFQAMEGWSLCSQFGGLSRWWPSLACVPIYKLLVYLGFAPELGIFTPVLLTYEFWHTIGCRCYS